MKHCFIICLILSFLFIDNSCNYIPDSFSITDTTFTIYDKYIDFKQDTLYLFNTKLGHIVDFRGVHSCTLLVNDEIFSATDGDSLYTRITHLKDTILNLNDSILGRAKFSVEDIINWKIAEYHFEYPDDFLLGVLFSEYIDSADHDSITQAINNSSPLTASQKEIIVTALNEMIGTFDFYHKYRDYIVQEIFMQQITDEINRLIHESIWLDTTGALKTAPLTEYEKETLKWFYRHIFTRYLGMAPGFKSFMIRTYPVAERIHSMLFQQGPAENEFEKEIKRFIGVNKFTVYQHAYIDHHGSLYTDFTDKKITDIPLLTGTDWTAPLLFWPDVPLIPYEMVDSLVLPGRAVLQYNRQLSTGDSARYDLKLYYPVSGTILQNSKPVRVIGSIIMTIGIMNFFNALNPLKAALFRVWDTDITIKGISANGDIKVYKEKSRMVSDDMVH